MKTLIQIIYFTLAASFMLILLLDAHSLVQVGYAVAGLLVCVMVCAARLVCVCRRLMHGAGHPYAGSLYYAGYSLLLASLAWLMLWHCCMVYGSMHSVVAFVYLMLGAGSLAVGLVRINQSCRGPADASMDHA